MPRLPASTPNTLIAYLLAGVACLAYAFMNLAALPCHCLVPRGASGPRALHGALRGLDVAFTCLSSASLLAGTCLRDAPEVERKLVDRVPLLSGLIVVLAVASNLGEQALPWINELLWVPASVAQCAVPGAGVVCSAAVAWRGPNRSREPTPSAARMDPQPRAHLPKRFQHPRMHPSTPALPPARYVATTLAAFGFLMWREVFRQRLTRPQRRWIVAAGGVALLGAVSVVLDRPLCGVFGGHFTAVHAFFAACAVAMHCLHRYAHLLGGAPLVRKKAR